MADRDDDYSNPFFDSIDPTIAAKPHKWLTPGGMMNPLNPVGFNHEPDVPKVESPEELKARHKNLDDSQAKAQKDYSDAMDKAHALLASGTNYSHEDMHDLAMKAADAQRLAAHLRAMRAQLPPLPKTGTNSPAYKARMAAAQAASTNQPTAAALDTLAKARMAENPEK